MGIRNTGEGMMLTPLVSFEGEKGIQSWKGMVCGEAVAKLRDAKSFAKARDRALIKMAKDAFDRKADAVIGVRIDVATGGPDGNTVIVSTYGTAVQVG